MTLDAQCESAIRLVKETLTKKQREEVARWLELEASLAKENQRGETSRWLRQCAQDLIA